MKKPPHSPSWLARQFDTGLVSVNVGLYKVCSSSLFCFDFEWSLHVLKCRSREFSKNDTGKESNTQKFESCLVYMHHIKVVLTNTQWPYDEKHLFSAKCLIINITNYIFLLQKIETYQTNVDEIDVNCFYKYNSIQVIFFSNSKIWFTSNYNSAKMIPESFLIFALCVTLSLF